MSKNIEKVRAELQKMGIAPQIIDHLFPISKPVLKVVSDKKEGE